MTYNRYRWFEHLTRLRGTVLPIIFPRIVLFAIWSIVVVWMFNRGWAPAVPPSVHGVLGTVLGLMLAFRTNTAYDRFWEGRKAWGAITNRSRDLARQSLTYLGPGATIQDVGRLLAAFVHGTKRTLWESGEGDELVRLLGETRAASMRAAPGYAQRPLIELGQTVSTARKLGHLTDFEHQLFDRNITELLDQLGACQRIKSTPIPFAYVAHLRRFLLVYTLTLPFALAKDAGSATPFIMLMIGYAMFGVEEIGVQIEDPFEQDPNDIDLEHISNNIERDLAAVTGDSSCVQSTGLFAPHNVSAA
jgi:ion channel-forming bestrophin family protein